VIAVHHNRERPTVSRIGIQVDGARVREPEQRRLADIV
jgi:hypothetical protein